MRVGFVGWRGMVGSVLMQRMVEERDFDLIDPVFFSTSNTGGAGPAIGRASGPLRDGLRTPDIARPGEPVVGTRAMGAAVRAALS